MVTVSPFAQRRVSLRVIADDTQRPDPCAGGNILSNVYFLPKMETAPAPSLFEFALPDLTDLIEFLA